MPVKFSEKFLSTPLRESGGSTASSRFDYQSHWALCYLLNVHDAHQDYLLVLEYHDDVVLFDSSRDPKKAFFYQVKTSRDDHWTINKMISIKKGERNSILGKLYLHRLNFTDYEVDLNFVTNSGFKFKLKGKSKAAPVKRDLRGIDLANDENLLLNDALKNEHSLTLNPEYEKITNFIWTDLSLNDFANHTKGKLTSFLQNKLPGVRILVPEAYRTLIDEIKRRSSRSETYDDFDAFKKDKCISKAEFNQMMTQMKSEVDARWVEVSSRLNTENVPFGKVKELSTNWKHLQIVKADETNFTLKATYDKLRNFVIDHKDELIKNTLIESLAAAKQKYIAQNQMGKLENDYLEIMLLEIIYEQ